MEVVRKTDIYIRVTQAVADRHTDGQMYGQTLCDNKG